MTDGIVERLCEGVWVGIPAPGDGSMGAIVGRDGIVVVDATSYDIFAERFLAAVTDAEGDRPVRFLHITHRHFDHFGGACALDAIVVGHRLTREAMAAYPEGWVERNLAEWVEAEMVIPSLLRSPKVVLPQVLFEDALEINLGDQSVHLLHIGGHCADQTVAYVPGARVLFASDAVFNGKQAYVGDGDLATWITGLRDLAEMRVDLVVPGHGPVGGPELLQTQRVWLEELRDQQLRGGP